MTKTVDPSVIEVCHEIVEQCAYKSDCGEEIGWLQDLIDKYNKTVKKTKPKQQKDPRRQCYGTPQWLFDKLDKEFGFTLDACASDWNTKCEKYHTEKEDGLLQPWKGHTVWCHPPYSNIEAWLNKGVREARENGVVSVHMVTNSTDSVWFHKRAALGEVYYLRGRIDFIPHPEIGKVTNNMRGTVLVVFDPATIREQAARGINAEVWECNYNDFVRVECA